MLTCWKIELGRCNIFFYFYTKLAESSFLCRFRVESVNMFICAMRFFFNKTISHMRKRFTEWVHCVGRLNAWRNIGISTGFKKIKQRRISFVLGYLRMILWKNSTAISIKHRRLATFNIKKSILTTCIGLDIWSWNSNRKVAYQFNTRSSKHFKNEIHITFVYSNRLYWPKHSNLDRNYCYRLNLDR